MLSTALLLSIFLVFNSVEYTLRLSSSLRGILLLTFIVVLLVVLYLWVLLPISRLMNLGKQLTHEEAAVQIGKYFPQINDKLLNTIQLHKNNLEDNSLIQASIAQRTKELSLFNFPQAVNFKENQRYLKFLAPPVVIGVVLMMFIPQFFSEGTERIINFNKEFVPEAPFEFYLESNNLQAFKNEDFSVDLRFKGRFEPSEAYIVIGGRKIKMQSSQDKFSYTFNNIQKATSFNFEAAGYPSQNYHIEVLSRPNLKGFNIDLTYPAYLKKDRKRIENAGNLLIPEGTVAHWSFKAQDVESIQLKFAKEEAVYDATEVGNQLYDFKKKMLAPDIYEVALTNKNAANKDEIKYSIDIVKDKYPTINVEIFEDTVLYQYLVLGGNVTDDYGLTRLNVRYQIEDEEKGAFKSFPLSISDNQTSQSFYFPWSVDSLQLQPGSQINYYLEVFDNDGVNGQKSTKTALYTFKVPSTADVKEKLENESNNTKERIAGSKEDATSLKKDIEDLENKLRGKKQLDWQDKKKAEDLIKKKETLNKAIEELQQKNQSNNQQKERFSEQDERIKEKTQQLQRLMDELLDEETKKLYEELKNLLDQQKDASQIQEQISKIKNKEQNLEKELERALELFKRMQFDLKLDEIVSDIDNLAKDQEKLSKEGEDNNNEEMSSQQELEKQQELRQKFEEVQEDIEKLKELNQDLEHSNPMQDTSEEEENIEKALQESEESLEKEKKKSAAKQQKKAADEMQKLGKKMQDMQMGMEMSMMEENLDHLRDILDNLVKLSFDQEALMNDFREVNQSDPRFVRLSQHQLKLKDDAKILEDSLLSLAKRVFQIQSFVTREVEEMNSHMTGSLESLRERHQAKAISSQQFAMTSMNNLALLLSDVLKQMQQQMADAMGKPQKGKGKGKQQSMALGDLQKQLNEKISELKKSGKTGRALSEELAKLAAEQEQIRRALQEELQKAENAAGEKGGGNSAKQLIEKMEETESDLVNKRLSENTIKRQQDILTRLLESENAMREREEDQERKAEQANRYEQIIPKAFDAYIKAKEKEIELLRSVPPKLNPYYIREVNEYFKRLNNTNI